MEVLCLQHTSIKERVISLSYLFLGGETDYTHHKGMDAEYLYINGIQVTPTAAQINLLAQGVAAGYKIARGTLTPVSASDTVVTGLSTVVAAVASLKGAPTLTHNIVVADIGDQAGTPVAGSILIKSYKPTGAADCTPVAATTPWSAVDLVAIGV